MLKSITRSEAYRTCMVLIENSTHKHMAKGKVLLIIKDTTHEQKRQGYIKKQPPNFHAENPQLTADKYSRHPAKNSQIIDQNIKI